MLYTPLALFSDDDRARRRKSTTVLLDVFQGLGEPHWIFN